VKEKTFSYGKQTISDEDIAAVVEALRSDWLTQGPRVSEFERALAVKFGANHATAVSSGTAALHLLGLALGWRKGDMILTSPTTFLATANSIVYAGATPGFVDIEAKSYTIDVEKVERKILQYREQGLNVKAVIGVDFAGHPCDWPSLRVLADKFDIQLVDDACHALGAELDGNISYAAKYADAVVMSFHPVKHITTGEGGAVLTNDAAVNGSVMLRRTHGMTKDEKILEANDGPWFYEMHELGYNYRITDIQCALGLSQLKRLDTFVSERRRIAQYYDKYFSNDERFITPAVAPNVRHSYHLYPLQVKFETLSVDKREFFSRLSKASIHCQVHYIPVHLQPYYRRNYGSKEGDLREAELFYKREVSIPMYPFLKTEDLDFICSQINSAIEG